MWGEGASWHEDHRTHPSEAQLLSLDSSKARHFLGWSTKLALEGALRQTVAWYKVCEEKKNMRDVTEAEIRDYVKGPCS